MPSTTSKPISKKKHTNYPINDFDYRLVDSGEFKKLERFGPHYFIRPAPQAIWQRRLPEKEWKQAVGEYTYSKGKEYGGEWEFFTELPEEGWPLCFRDLTAQVRPMGFGHIGLFPEQALNWIWIRDQIRNNNPKPCNVLNIFGYTGMSTLAAAAEGAKVTHVDAARNSVTCARKNLELSGLGERPVRWIVDDALKFLRREMRRGNRYDGIILDPPSFGRGPKSEVWKIEKDLSQLMDLCKGVLSKKPLFILATTHSPGFSALTLQNMILSYLVKPGSGTIESGEMFIQDIGSKLKLPSGFFSRWSRETNSDT